jgi:putative effector of murein hydrolase
MKSLRRYRVSKGVYAALLELSVVVDFVVAVAVYRVLERWVEGWRVLVVSFILASVLGVLLYLLHMWQMEFLTGGSDGSVGS